jgi:helix-turn-helix protein
VGATRRRTLDQLYSGPQVLEVPLYSVFEASRYLQIPENTLRSWVAGRSYPLRAGASRRSEPVIELADVANSRLSFSNLTEAHVLDALRRQYQVELPQIRRAVKYLREHFRSSHPWSTTKC